MTYLQLVHGKLLVSLYSSSPTREELAHWSYVVLQVVKTITGIVKSIYQIGEQTNSFQFGNEPKCLLISDDREIQTEWVLMKIVQIVIKSPFLVRDYSIEAAFSRPEMQMI